MMKKTIFLITAIFCALASVEANQEESLVSGRSIMEKTQERNYCQNETTNVKMEIVDSKNNTRVRRLNILKKRAQDRSLQVLIRFTAPEDVKGTGLLTIERKGREDDQWLYLPILKKNKRIAASSKRNSFVGTDFTFEDLRAENLDLFDYKLLREEDYQGEPCFVIEATPTPDEAKVSGYKSRIIWIRKDIYVPVRVEYTDMTGVQHKTESRVDIIKIKEGLWRADTIIMENLLKNQTTTLRVLERDIEKVIPDSMFTQVELEKG
jgi:hypothetical protein